MNVKYFLKKILTWVSWVIILIYMGFVLYHVIQVADKDLSKEERDRRNGQRLVGTILIALIAGIIWANLRQIKSGESLREQLDNLDLYR
jgi:membrane protein DedA with SNARE-associated domain